jgi:glycosyltransferase involved in cell wall biosynthesis
MKVSIVTISYNQAQFLERCLCSVIQQANIELEYIVVDPGSDDGSRDIISRYSDRITHVVLDQDRGPADGLNRGFALATGDVLGFLNSDDELLPNALSIVCDFFSRHKEKDIVSGCGIFVDELGNYLRPIIPSRWTSWLFSYGAVTIFQQGTFFRKCAFSRTAGFNIENTTCWDGELFMDMLLSGARHATIKDPLALFRLHQGSITGSGRLVKKYQEDRKRLFEHAVGRPTATKDRYIGLLASIAKFILNPEYVARNAWAKFR